MVAAISNLGQTLGEWLRQVNPAVLAPVFPALPPPPPPPPAAPTRVPFGSLEDNLPPSLLDFAGSSSRASSSSSSSSSDSSSSGRRKLSRQRSKRTKQTIQVKEEVTPNEPPPRTKHGKNRRPPNAEESDKKRRATVRTREAGLIDGRSIPAATRIKTDGELGPYPLRADEQAAPGWVDENSRVLCSSIDELAIPPAYEPPILSYTVLPPTLARHLSHPIHGLGAVSMTAIPVATAMSFLVLDPVLQDGLFKLDLSSLVVKNGDEHAWALRLKKVCLAMRGQYILFTDDWERWEADVCNLITNELMPKPEGQPKPMYSKTIDEVWYVVFALVRLLRGLPFFQVFDHRWIYHDTCSRDNSHEDTYGVRAQYVVARKRTAVTSLLQAALMEKPAEWKLFCSKCGEVAGSTRVGTLDLCGERLLVSISRKMKEDDVAYDYEKNSERGGYGLRRLIVRRFQALEASIMGIVFYDNEGKAQYIDVLKKQVLPINEGHDLAANILLAMYEKGFQLKIPSPPKKVPPHATTLPPATPTTLPPAKPREIMDIDSD